MFFSNFPVSCRHAHKLIIATASSKCHVSLAFVIFLQDLDPFVAYKAFSGYLLSFEFNVSNEKGKK